jgi:hypothetical protein
MDTTKESMIENPKEHRVHKRLLETINIKNNEEKPLATILADFDKYAASFDDNSTSGEKKCRVESDEQSTSKREKDIESSDEDEEDHEEEQKEIKVDDDIKKTIDSRKGPKNKNTMSVKVRNFLTNRLHDRLTPKMITDNPMYAYFIVRFIAIHFNFYNFHQRITDQLQRNKLRYLWDQIPLVITKIVHDDETNLKIIYREPNSRRCRKIIDELKLGGGTLLSNLATSIAANINKIRAVTTALHYYVVSKNYGNKIAYDMELDFQKDFTQWLAAKNQENKMIHQSKSVNECLDLAIKPALEELKVLIQTAGTQQKNLNRLIDMKRK